MPIRCHDRDMVADLGEVGRICQLKGENLILAKGEIG